MQLERSKSRRICSRALNRFATLCGSERRQITIGPMETKRLVERDPTPEDVRFCDLGIAPVTVKVGVAVIELLAVEVGVLVSVAWPVGEGV